MPSRRRGSCDLTIRTKHWQRLPSLSERMNLTEPNSGEIEPKRLDDFAQRLAAQPERHLSAQTL